MYPFCLCLQFTLLGAPLRLHHPQAARAWPSGVYLPYIYLSQFVSMLNLSITITFLIVTYSRSRAPIVFL